MLLHLCPRILTESEVSIFCLTIAAIGLTLEGGDDLVSRQPYQNKLFHVACRNIGRKAVNGIYIETPELPKCFSSEIWWLIDSARVVIHQVYYTLLDNDFDTASENMLLWYGQGRWPRRFPSCLGDLKAMHYQPAMETTDDGYGIIAFDEVDTSGRITKRMQEFSMPTIERGRLMGTEYRTRMPRFEHAFQTK